MLPKSIRPNQQKKHQHSYVDLDVDFSISVRGTQGLVEQVNLI